MGWKAALPVLVPVLLGIFTVSPVAAIPQLGVASVQQGATAAVAGVQESVHKSASNSSQSESSSTSVLSVASNATLAANETSPINSSTSTVAPPTTLGPSLISNTNINSNSISNANVNSISNTNVNSNTIHNANVNAISNTNVNSNLVHNANLNAISNTNVNSNLVANKNLNSNILTSNPVPKVDPVPPVAHDDDDDDDDDSDEFDDDEEVYRRRPRPHRRRYHHHHHYDYATMGMGLPMMPLSFASVASPVHYHHDHYYHHKRPRNKTEVAPAIQPQPQPGPVYYQPSQQGPVVGQPGPVSGPVVQQPQQLLSSSYFGVQFNPFVRLENYSYSVEDIKTMLRVILTKYHNVQAYDLVNNGTFNGTSLENSPVSLIAQAAALLNQETKSLTVSVLRNARVLEASSSSSSGQIGIEAGARAGFGGNGSEINGTVHIGNVMGSASIGNHASAFVGSSGEVLISEQQTEIDQTLQNIQSANQLYPGTVWGLTLGVNSILEGGHITDIRSGRLVYLQAQKLVERTKSLNLRLGAAINICEEIYGPNQDIRAMLLDLSKVTDFFVCSIYPQAPVVSVEQYFQNLTGIYSKIRESFQQVAPNLEIILDTGLPSEGAFIRNPASGPELSTVSKMVSFWELVENWSLEYKVRVFMHEAFDVPQAIGESHYGYWYSAPDNSNRYIVKATGQYVVL